MTTETPVEAFAPYAGRCGYVLLMTTTPGKSGGVFNKDTFRKIRQFRRMFPTHQIQVDGGVNAEVSFILRNLGVQCAVVGSFLFKNQTVGPALLHLKKEVVSSRFTIKDFMIEVAELPVLELRRLTFEDVLRTIDRYALAFVLMVDEGKFAGLISNADVRKGLLRCLPDLNRIEPLSLINRRPIVIGEEQTISELLEVVKKANFPLQYIPVVNAAGDLTGALTFTQLIKAEA
jgi:CBS domain-containing protein